MGVMADLRRRYEAAVQAGDVRVQVQCLWEAVTFVQEGGIDEADYFAQRFRLLFWWALQSLVQGDGAGVLALQRAFSIEVLDQLNMFPRVQRYFGQALLAMGESQAATAQLREYLVQYADDEEGWYYLGNACYLQKDFTGAGQAYEQALTLRPDFLAAQLRTAELFAALGDASVLAAVPEAERMAWAQLAAPDYLLPVRAYTVKEIRQFPVFINVRDRVEGLRLLVAWLRRAGQENIILLDNASTYPPLLMYMDELVKQGVQVYHLPNLGYKALWQSGLLRQLHIRTPYIYTDPDVVPLDACPLDIVERCYRVLWRYPSLDKVGLSILTEDITCAQRETIQHQEAAWQMHHVAPGLVYAATDTTFALYRGQYHYSLAASVRLEPPCTLRHLPWYYDERNLPADEAYYRAHADNSSSLVNLLRQQTEQA